MESSGNGITGKVVAITGASSGIGEVTARLLAEQGAHVVLGARRAERLHTLAAAITEAGGSAAWREVDVRRPQDVAALVALAQERFGRLDVIVNNAGVGPISRLDELRVQEWEDMIDINVKGVLNGIAATLPVFRAQGSGHVITTGSTAAFRVLPTMAVYAATKMAIGAISEGLRQEAGPDLRVTVVAPGFTWTDFVDGASDAGLRTTMQARRDEIAMPPSAVARAIAFAIAQPPEVDVGEIVVRPTAQD